MRSTMATHAHKPGRFLLLYGSQTGQAQAIAEEIFERSPKHGLLPELHCMSMLNKKFQVENERCVVMVTSTTGDGDPPDTAIKFVRRFNRKILPSDYLASLHYSVLGLGDSNYSNFCNNAKNIDQRFSELGAQRFLPSAFADEVDGLDVTADPWIDALFPALQKLVGTVPSSSSHSQDAGCLDASQAPDHPQCNGSDHGPSSPFNSVSVIHSSGNDSERTLVPVVPNGSVSLDKSHDTDMTISVDKTQDTDTLASHTVDYSNRSKTETFPAHDVCAEGADTNVKTALVDSDHRQQTSENSVSRTPDREQIVEKGAQDMNSVKNGTGSDGLQQKETEDTLELNTPVSDVPSLGVSTAALAEKTLTLPAATPAFLTASYLPPDQDLKSKMAALPWQNDCKPPSAASGILKATVVSAQRLTAEDAVKKTLLLKLCVQDGSLTYRPGDSVSVICANEEKEVSQLIKRLGLVAEADLPLKLGIIPDTKKRRAAVPPHVPEEGASLRYILKNCIDIRQPPKKALLRLLADHAPVTSEQRRLQELCSKEGGEDYTAFVHGQHVSLLDVLYTFPSCRPPVGRLIEHLPRLQPRPYSICSCQDWRPGHVDITFNVVVIPPSHSRLYGRRGLCTGWLDDITSPLQWHCGKDTQAADTTRELAQRMELVSLAKVEVQIFARTNQHFRTPNDLSLPLIMIGPGTGVAPYIGFLQERELRLQREESGCSVGETWLLFGCRHKAKDLLFQSAVEEFQNKKVLTRFLPAFSRDAHNDPDTPRYVQDNIRAHAPDMCRLIEEEGAVVFVCGDAKHMAADVAAAFEDIFVQEQGLSADKAKEHLMTMRIRHRYLEDVWT